MEGGGGEGGRGRGPRGGGGIVRCVQRAAVRAGGRTHGGCGWVGTARTGSGGTDGPAIPAAPAEGGSAGGPGVTWPRRGRRSIWQGAIQRESASGRAGERKSERAGGGWEGGRAGGREGARQRAGAGSGRRARVPCAHRERRGRWTGDSNRSGGRRQRRRARCHLAAARLEVNTAGGNSA